MTTFYSQSSRPNQCEGRAWAQSPASRLPVQGSLLGKTTLCGLVFHVGGWLWSACSVHSTVLDPPSF